MLHTFTDGTPALASEVNTNFQTLAAAVNATDCATAAEVVCNPALSCPACDTAASFIEGRVEGVDSVDITTDNAAAQAVAAAAAGSAACTQAGGTWAAGTSTCAAAPLQLYNCFVGGFCSQAAIGFPPASFGYPNAYVGDTQGAGSPLAAGCNVSPANHHWVSGQNTYSIYIPVVNASPWPLATLALCASN